VYGPDGRQNISVRRDLRLLGELPVLVVDMAINLSDDSLDKVCSIWLTKYLIRVHNFPHHLSVEGDGVAHAIL
jgi:hypothetical protein